MNEKKGVNVHPAVLRQLRKDAGLTQEAMAQLIYVARRTYQDWEQGIAKCHPAFFELLEMKVKRNLKAEKDGTG